MFPGFRSAEHAEKVMGQIIDYCNYCNYRAYFHCFRSELTMPSTRAFVLFVWPTNRRSKWDTESGRQLPSDIAWRLGPLPLAEKRCGRSGAESSADWFWYERQDRGRWWWVYSAAARRLRYAHGDRLPSLRCATVPSEGFRKWSLPTYLLLAWKSNNHQISTNNWEQIIIK